MTFCNYFINANSGVDYAAVYFESGIVIKRGLLETEDCIMYKHFVIKKWEISGSLYNKLYSFRVVVVS